MRLLVMVTPMATPAAKIQKNICMGRLSACVSLGSPTASGKACMDDCPMGGLAPVERAGICIMPEGGATDASGAAGISGPGERAGVTTEGGATGIGCGPGTAFGLSPAGPMKRASAGARVEDPWHQRVGYLTRSQVASDGGSPAAPSMGRPYFLISR